MKIWKQHTTPEILKSLESEVAKAVSEVNCAKRDIDKAHSRLQFALTAIHALKDRQDPKDMKPQ